MKRLIVGVLLLGSLAAPGPAAEALALFHFELSKSAPAAGAEVHEVSEVRLWFTQEPQENTTSIRLIDGGGDAVETGDVVQDADDGRVFSVAVDAHLVPGRYTVAWRAMGQDGHVVRDDFAFSVAGH